MVPQIVVQKEEQQKEQLQEEIQRKRKIHRQAERVQQDGDVPSKRSMNIKTSLPLNWA